MEMGWKEPLEKEQKTTGEPSNVMDMLAQMRQIFADRDQEYIQMEQSYQQRKKALDEKEADIWVMVADLEKRAKELDGREEMVKNQEQAIQSEVKKLTGEREALLSDREKLETEKTKQWMEVSLLREQARNENLRYQRLCGEYEGKLADLPADSPYLASLHGEDARKGMEDQRKELEKRLKEKEKENQELLKQKASFEEDIASLHQIAKELAEEKERLQEENQRLQEEKGELFKKLMGGEGTPSFMSEEPSTDKEPEEEPADVSWEGDDPLTADSLLAYLNGQGADARILHAMDGELVSLSVGELNIVFSFRQPPRFDIRKSQKGGWGMKKLIKRYNENNAGLSFTYDESEEELIGSAELDPDVSPEELVYKVYQAAKIYFGYRDDEE